MRAVRMTVKALEAHVAVEHLASDNEVVRIDWTDTNQLWFEHLEEGGRLYVGSAREGDRDVLVKHRAHFRYGALMSAIEELNGYGTEFCAVALTKHGMQIFCHIEDEPFVVIVPAVFYVKNPPVVIGKDLVRHLVGRPQLPRGAAALPLALAMPSDDDEPTNGAASTDVDSNDYW